jgi:hypothetical protein
VDWSFIAIAVLAVFGAALIAGGVVAYRGSTRVAVRAYAAAAITAGIVMLALVLFITPVSVTRTG